MRSSDHLTDGGQDLLDALVWEGMPTEGVALALEAARLKSRLDTLHAILSGREESLLAFVDDLESKEIILRVDAVLAEARQTATVFRQTLNEVRRGWPADGAEDEEDDLANL